MDPQPYLSTSPTVPAPQTCLWGQHQFSASHTSTLDKLPSLTTVLRLMCFSCHMRDSVMRDVHDPGTAVALHRTRGSPKAWGGSDPFEMTFSVVVVVKL